MRALHENQRKILDFLLARPGGATLDELAAELGLTRTATREHLLRLDGLGFLEHRDTRGTVGRPRRRYLLSAAGQEAFPRQYSWLSTVLLELLAEDLGAEAVAKVMENLAAKVSASMRERFERAPTPARRLQEVAAALNELGYRASLRQSDLRKGAVIEATNCVYHSVAKAHPALCRFDVKFIEKATGGLGVELTSCIAKGGAVCRFCIRKKA